MAGGRRYAGARRLVSTLDIDDEDTAEAIGIGGAGRPQASTARAHPVEIAAIGHRAGSPRASTTIPRHGVYHPAPPMPPPSRRRRGGIGGLC